MSTALIELDNRIITDKGEVVAKYELLVEKALSGEVFTDYLALPHDDIERYNRVSGFEHPITTWTDDNDGIKGPDLETFEWTIPKQFQALDITELCIQALVDKHLSTDEYVNRLTWELNRMDEKAMFPFVRCLMYIIHQLRTNNVVWGVGRGSSCASLIMFLLDINRIDPVKYGIPAEEFYK